MDEDKKDQIAGMVSAMQAHTLKQQTLAAPSTEQASLFANRGEAGTVTREASAPPAPAHDQAKLLFEKLGPVIIVDPTECNPYPGAPRAGITAADISDGDLTDSIRSHGVIEPIILLERQKERMILGGNRRCAIVGALHAEGTLIPLPARIASFTDLEAVAFAHAQNVGRLDPTPMEQAASVKWALENLGANQAAVAIAMGISEQKVSRLLVLSSLPEWVIAVVTDPASLSENFAGELQRPLGNPAKARDMEKRANALLRKGKTLPGPAAARYLVSGNLEPDETPILDRSGVRHGTLKPNLRGGITLRVSPSYALDGADIESIHEMLAEKLLAAMKQIASRSR